MIEKSALGELYSCVSCKKCGQIINKTMASYTYHWGTVYDPAIKFSNNYSDYFDDVIVVKCGCCGYSWLEKTIS